MDIEEAIALLKYGCLVGPHGQLEIPESKKKKYMEAIEMAVAAILAQQQAKKNGPLVLLREIIDFQESYRNLFMGNKITKKDICQLVIPYRDKYGLKDLEALKIARGELSLAEIERFISSHCYSPVKEET